MNNDKDYVMVHQWMFDIDYFKPKSKGCMYDYQSLLIYAYIYSYSRDGKSKWHGRQQTLAELLHGSEQTVCRKLKELTEAELINCERVVNYGMFHHNNYSVNMVNRVLIGVNSVLTNNSISNNIDTTNIDASTGVLGDGSYNIYKAPTVDEIRTYATLKGFGKAEFDYQYFFNHYDASDWTDVGGKKINWKQTLLKWLKNQKDMPSTNTRSQNKSSGKQKYKSNINNNEIKNNIL